MEEDTTQCSWNNFLRSYEMPGLDRKKKYVLYPRATHCAANTKKILFPSSFWGIFDFFVFFNNFGKRIKECYVTKEE
jgi:hypothetical protein